MNLFLLCFKIFFARILDVSLGTIRTVYIVKEKRIIATLIAFFEVLIWFEVAREALNTTFDSIIVPISYAAGYATGTYIGTYLSSNLIKGNVTITIISKDLTIKEINMIKKKGFGVSIINTYDKKKYLIIEIDKKRINELKKLILSLDKKAFIMINDTKIVENGYVK